ncbi:MAG: lactonase family protein [Gammaproteobacteria bacterium]|nr:lactonase family protein [Gammaproteobacteria bacterium]
MTRVVLILIALIALFYQPAQAELSFVDWQWDGVGGVNGLNSAWSVAISPDGAHLYAAGFEDDAIAVFVRDENTGELVFLEAYRDGTEGVEGLDGARAVTVSPDGAHVYAAGYREDAVAVFTRDISTGALTPTEVQRQGVGGVNGLNGASSVTLSPDGLNLYVTGSVLDTVAVFARIPSTGSLRFVEVLQDGMEGVDGLAGATSIAVSPGGQHLYVASHADDAVAVFTRDSTDEGEGRLGFVGAIKDDDYGIDGLNYAVAVAVSPDGANVYATGRTDDAVAVFARDETTGELTFQGAIRNDPDEVEGLDGATGIAIAPTGDYLYVVSRNDDALVVFTRDEDGQLEFLEAQYDDTEGVDGLDSASSVAVSPDGSHVYGTGWKDDALVVFSQNGTTGELSFREVHWDDTGGVNGLEAATSVALSPDGVHLYVAGQDDNALVVFERDQITGQLFYIDTLYDGIGVRYGLTQPSSVTVSPDGAHVYVTGFTANAVTVFERDTTTGMLGFVEVQRDGTGGVNGLDGAETVSVSPDGRHVYATGFNTGTVVAFLRDETTGQLNFLESLQNGTGTVDGLLGARDIVLSPSGSHVYVTGAWDDSIAVFSRNVNTGQLSFLEVQRNGIAGVSGLAFAHSIAISSDGAHLYATGSNDDAIIVFQRNRATGRLSFLEYHRDGVEGVQGLYDATAVSVSPDGMRVYVAATLDNALTVFERDTQSGHLKFMEVRRKQTQGLEGIEQPSAISVSPDDRYVHVASLRDHAVAVFQRDFGPDTDGDDIPDVFDNCPATPSRDQRDTDADDQGDICDPDDDNDDLSDVAEAQWGSDPLVADSDGDGIPDGAEVAVGRNPTLDESKTVIGILLLIMD